MSLNEIIDEYDNKNDSFHELSNRTKTLISALCKDNNIIIHEVQTRVKNKASLVTKVKENENKYNKLSDITDIVGIRIITYFNDEVDKLAKIVEEEFEIDRKNSIDKRIVEPDKFGYSSLHYIAEFNSKRIQLIEYRNFKGMKFEIQIRSVLQHAWAEIEHDLGYKSNIEIPEKIRRDFSRVSGLLELADMEFLRIKKFLQTYSMQVVQNIESNNLNIPVDKITLDKFVKENDDFIELENGISKLMGSNRNSSLIEGTIKRIKYLNINTIGELNEHLLNYRKRILEFVERWIDRSSTDNENGYVGTGISIFYLAYIMVAESEDEDKVYNYYREFGIGEFDKRKDNSKEVIRIYKLIK